MPPQNAASSGSLTGPPLWTLTAVVIGVAGILFFFVSEPLASAFDLLLPSSVHQQAAEPVEPPPVVQEEPEEPPPPPPKIWTPAEIEAGMAELGETLPALVEAGRSELPTYEDLGADDEANAQRAAARWGRWGVVWHNRVDAERTKMPPREQCLPHEDLRFPCTEVHEILDAIESVSQATTYETAETRLDEATERLDLYLNPPPPPDDEEDDEAGEPDSLDVAESPE